MFAGYVICVLLTVKTISTSRQWHGQKFPKGRREVTKQQLNTFKFTVCVKCIK